MNVNDMVLVSVDDHVVEPPDVFEGRVAAKYREHAPRFITRDDGTNVWEYNGETVGNVALNAVAGRPKEEYGIEPTSFTQLRPARTTTTNGSRTHERQRRPRLVIASRRSRSSAVSSSPAPRTRTSPWRWCRPTTTGTSTSGAAVTPVVHPVRDPGDLGPRVMAAEIRRVAQKGCHALTFSENPSKLGWPSIHSDTGTRCGGPAARIRRGVHAHRILLAAHHHLARCAHGCDDHAAADEHRAGGRRPGVVDHPAQVPGSEVRAVRGWNRLDPLLSGAYRLQLRPPPRLDRTGFRRPAAQRGCSTNMC